MERLHLYRIQFPGEKPPGYALLNCLFMLAAQRPDLYCLWDASAENSIDQNLCSPCALVVRQYGDVMPMLARLLIQAELKTLLARGVPLILDNSTEAGFCSLGAWHSFRTFLEGLSLGRLQMIVLQQHALSAQECKDCFRDHPTLQIQSVVFHHWMHRMVMAFRSMDWAAFNRAKLQYPPRYRYLCLNGYPRSHRAVIVGHLAARKLLGDGMVSISKVTTSQGDLWMNRSRPGPHEFLEQCLGDFPGQSEDLWAYEQLMKDGLDIKEDAQPAGMGSAQSLLAHLCIQSQFSLVAETEMSSGEVLRFTEKSLRPLASFHPILVAGNPGTLKLLRIYDFRTFEPWIDERYDCETNSSKRLGMVLGEARRLISMPESDFARLLKEMEGVLLHNHSIFRFDLEQAMSKQHAGLIAAIKNFYHCQEMPERA